jgi:predicted transposase/invertase (TIGR01784 family)
MYFFKHAARTTPDQLAKLISADQIIDQAYHALNQCYWSDDEITTYEEELKSERDGRAIHNAGLEEGLVKGKVEGKEEKAREIARNLFALGLDIQTVASATHLPMDELEDLREHQTV